ncbi:MAG: MtaA/CmuA family methyltransferase [Desulfobacteraceae bacterium]|nr:MtaA/CmuA family methyltransferase [Desulfobacteraceae bacterium]
MDAELSSRERVLRFFRKEKIDRLPVFSGMGNITVHGIEKYNWKFVDIHVDARKMASVAASTFQLFGFECAVVPFDMGVEAEALGAGVNFYPDHTDVVYPTISDKIAEKVADLNLEVPSDLAKEGRIPLVTEAIRLLKEEIGEQVPIGAWVLGPYTLAGQLVDISDLAKMAFKKKDIVNNLLEILDGVLIEISRIYREAGADYMTIREMGAGPDILSPRMFKTLIRPHLEKIFAAIESPKILHICGDTNSIVEDMALCGADGMSVEQQNDVAESRKKVGHELLILGNVDPYGVMVNGKPNDIDNAVKEAIANGADAPWPGDDIFPTVPWENMEALITATKKYGKVGG